MPTLAPGWELDVARGPGWLVVRFRPKDADAAEVAQLADELWSLAERHFVYRLVLELDLVNLLHSALVGQLLLLHRRLHDHDGCVKLCGLSQYNREVLRRSGLASRLPTYDSLEEALMGSCPRKPR